MRPADPNRPIGGRIVNLAEYEEQDGLGLAVLVARGDVTPGELLDLALARCAAVNPRINAVVAWFETLARTAIAEGLPPGPFRGVPLLLKDEDRKSVV